MSVAVRDSLLACAWALGGGLLAWLVTIPLRRKSLAYLLLSVVVVGSAATLAAMLGSFRAMFISNEALVVTISVSFVAGVIASATALVSSRRQMADRAVLSAALAEMAAGRVPMQAPRKLSSELEVLRGQLSDTAVKLAESRARERAVESSRRQLVAFLSHDLRTPLAGLRAMSEALEDGVAEDPTQYYKQIRAETDRLTSMVNDLFDLSRIQAGSFSVESETVSLEDVVSDCIAALTPLARARGVQLRGASANGITVTGDGHQLSRALTNLLANAIRYTRADGAIEVRVSHEHQQAEVSVRDECGGIPEHDLIHVFDIGFRGEPARTRSHSPENGTNAGFGLAITRGIVEAHRGTIDVDNAGRGCVFTVRLPITA